MEIYMPEKQFDPNLIGLIIAMTMGIFGSFIRLWKDWNGRKMNRTNIRNAVIDIFGSLFFTVSIYMLTVWWIGMHPMAGAAVGGLAGHLGTRQTILILQKYLGRNDK
jgi:hypothetical protein